MWIVATIIMRWATNAAWVENQRAIKQLNQMLLVAVPTQNHACPNITNRARIVDAGDRTSRRFKVSSMRF
jgi:hypothetical protein